MKRPDLENDYTFDKYEGQYVHEKRRTTYDNDLMAYVEYLESLTQQDEPSCKRCGGTGMIPMRAGGYDWCPECGGKKEKR